jgi:hypothetical protein
VGRGEVSFLERYAGGNMARKIQSVGKPLSPFLLAPLFFASRFTAGTSEFFNLEARIHED